MNDKAQARIPAEAWEVLANFPSPEDLHRAANLIAAVELERMADTLGRRSTSHAIHGNRPGSLHYSASARALKARAEQLRRQP